MSGDSTCRPMRLLPLLLLVLALAGLTPALPATAADVGIWKLYPPGWNLIAGPAGSRLGLHDEILFNLDGMADDYTQSSSPIAQAGAGYWVYYPNGATLLLIGAPQDVSVAHLAGGHWATIGNSGTRVAVVRGADIVLAYEPGGGFASVSTVQPGQAALVYVSSDADVLLDPYSLPLVKASALPLSAPVPPPPLPQVQAAPNTPTEELNYLIGLNPLLVDVSARLGNFADGLDTADPSRPAAPVWADLRNDADAVARDLISLQVLPTPLRYRDAQADLLSALSDISDGMRETIAGLLGGQSQRVTLGSGLLASGARRLDGVLALLP